MHSFTIQWKQQRARARMTRKKRKREGTDLQPHEDSASHLLFFSEASSSVGIGKLAFTLSPRYLRNLLLYVRQLIATREKNCKKQIFRSNRRIRRSFIKCFPLLQCTPLLLSTSYCLGRPTAQPRWALWHGLGHCWEELR